MAAINLFSKRVLVLAAPFGRPAPGRGPGGAGADSEEARGAGGAGADAEGARAEPEEEGGGRDAGDGTLPGGVLLGHGWKDLETKEFCLRFYGWDTEGIHTAPEKLAEKQWAIKEFCGNSENNGRFWLLIFWRGQYRNS